MNNATNTATMKIKVPKRDANDKLVIAGGAILYEEKTLTSGTPLEVNINKLGEPDTVLTITVTAEDGVTTKEYTVTIHRPSALIKGSIQLGENLRQNIERSAGELDEDIRKSKKSASMQAATLRMQGQNLRTQAKIAKQAGKSQFVSGILGGISDMALGYGIYSSAPENMGREKTGEIGVPGRKPTRG